ncbi:hypothetical protein V498_07802 [Pseudogymnoascus sp. VKM F-4517 (FW-2822)]|nr:hypothetical protein V498_07802 [Pseudogymnoascus sp. VKM F-4517 (FW-2822)]
MLEALKEVAPIYNNDAKEGNPYFSKAKKSYTSKGKDCANNPTTKDITNPITKDIVTSFKALLYYTKVLAKLRKAKSNRIKAATLAFSIVVGVALNTY